MKLQIMRVLLALLLGTLITACSFNKSDSNPTNTSTSVLAQITSDNTTNAIDTALKVYKAVLQNKAEFYNTDTMKNQYFNDFLVNNGTFDTAFKTLHFAVLDMDGDKIPEVVIELVIGDNDYAEFYEVLHYADDKVNGYIFSNRCLGDVKADGTFGYSSGASDNGFGKLSFQGSTSVTDSIGYMESKGSDNQEEVYYINSKQVTSDEYESFEKEQLAKQGPTWCEFSENGIDKAFSVNP